MQLVQSLLGMRPHLHLMRVPKHKAAHARTHAAHPPTHPVVLERRVQRPKQVVADVVHRARHGRLLAAPATLLLLRRPEGKLQAGPVAVLNQRVRKAWGGGRRERVGRPGERAAAKVRRQEHNCVQGGVNM